MKSYMESVATIVPCIDSGFKGCFSCTYTYYKIITNLAALIHVTPYLHPTSTLSAPTCTSGIMFLAHINTLEFRLNGTKINGKNKEGGNITLAVELKTLVSYCIRCTPGY